MALDINGDGFEDVAWASGGTWRYMLGALFRFEYRYRRVLDDPIADFTEHQLMSGLSLLFGNRP
jgi:hypothetical protein